MANFTDPKTISSTIGISIDPANCVLWLDASDINTFYQLSASNGVGYDPSQPVSGDGQPVGVWLDKSGYNHNFGVISVANRPVYSLSSVVFDPSVTFKWLECIDENIYSYRTNTTDSLSGLTIFIVSQLNSSAGGATRVLFTQLSTTNVAVGYNSAAITSPIVVQAGSSLQAWGKTTSARVTHSANSDYLTTINPFIPTITTVYTYNNLLQLMVGGNPANVSAPTFSNGDTTIKRIRIGADLNNFTTPTSPYYGNIREVIVYNIPLTFQQQKFVEAYLGEKWGAPYNAYPDNNGNFSNPAIWFNNVVPQLSTATVLANGYTIDISSSGVYPRLQNKRFTNWGWADPGISKGGTFNINGTVDLVTETILQDLPWGDLLRAASTGQVGGEATSPVITINTGSTLNLSAQKVQCLSYLVPAIQVNTGGAININVPLLYAHSTSPVLRCDGGTAYINQSTLASSNRAINTTTAQPGPIIEIINNGTGVFQSCNLTNLITNLVPDTESASGLTHVYNLHSTTTFNNCTINSYGTRNSGGTTGTSTSTGAGVYINSSGSNSTAYFQNCTFEASLTPGFSTITADKMGVHINNSGSRAYFNECIIKGSNFDTTGVARSHLHAGVYIVNGGLAQINNSTITGGNGKGTLNASTTRYDNIGTYPAAIKVSGATSSLTLSSCQINGNNTNKAQGVHMSSGILETYECSFYAGVDSNAINGTASTAKISGPVTEDSFTGYRAIALPKYFISPVPRNSYIKYATDGTGLGFNAFTYQYTIDSLSAFSMPDVSAVRLGTPYAGGLLVGTAVIPPAEAVSYGTLVDNTTGSAILTLDLLNTFFQTPLTALAAPELSATIGYRVANSLASNESIGHLIASFTTN